MMYIAGVLIIVLVYPSIYLSTFLQSDDSSNFKQNLQLEFYMQMKDNGWKIQRLKITCQGTHCAGSCQTVSVF